MNQPDIMTAADRRSAPDAQFPPAAESWRGVFILLIAYILSMLDRQIMSLVIEPMRRDLLISDVEISLLTGFAFVLFYSLFGLLFGRLADRGNRRWLIVAGMTVWCLATAATGLANTISQIFVARVLVGIGEAVLTPCAFSMIADLFPPERRGRAASVYQMGPTMGAGTALALGGLMIVLAQALGSLTLPLAGIVTGWRLVFVIVGLSGLLIVALVLLGLREPDRHERVAAAESMPPIAFFRSQAAPLSVMIVTFCMPAVVNIGLTIWMPTWFVRNHGWSLGQVGGTLGGIGMVFGTAGALFGGWAVDWLRRRGHRAPILVLAWWSSLLLLPMLVTMGLVHSAGAMLVVIVLVNFTGSIFAALTPLGVFEFAINNYRGQLTSLILFANMLVGYGLGPLLIAAIAEHILESPLSLARSMSLVGSGAMLLSIFAQRIGRGWHAPPAPAAAS